jgi:PBSX family phage terminase large subunit
MSRTNQRAKTVRLTDLIAPSFYGLHRDVANGAHTFYKLAGGRGSTKSSFVGTEIPLGIMRDAAAGRFTNAAALRRYGVDLKDSVYTQLLWAIDKLGVSPLWRSSLSPLRLTYKPTGQQILFRGADDPMKMKSIKVPRGYIKYLWLEELDEFEGPEKIRSIQQSVLRGGDKFTVFYSFNPPRSQRSWVNDPTAFSEPGMVEHHSTYLTVPREWLGNEFILEAEHLKAAKPEAYEHEYMGIATGTGGEVFTNVKIRTITDTEIAMVPRHRFGIDWGFAVDPFAFVACGYDHKKRRLLLCDEVYKAGLTNLAAAEQVKQHGGLGRDIICDSAEPKSIAEVRGYGLRVRGAKKGPDSVEYGIHWLQGLDEIVIDEKRCPNAAKEFIRYELDRDARGEFKAGYPDHDNHAIDAVRYACEDDMSRSGTHIGW